MNKINFLFVTLFGIGKLKKIPGSYASLSTTILYFIHCYNCILLISAVAASSIILFIATAPYHLTKNLNQDFSPFICRFESTVFVTFLIFFALKKLIVVKKFFSGSLGIIEPGY